MSDFAARLLAWFDEHGRKDGTPAEITFEVGYPPCVQCVEILPKSNDPSAFDPSLECLEDTSPATLENHPCFGDTTVRIARQVGVGGGAVGVDCAQNFVNAAADGARQNGASNASFFVADVQMEDLRGPYDHAFGARSWPVAIEDSDVHVDPALRAAVMSN